MPPEDFSPDDPRGWLIRAAGNLRIARSLLPGVELAELCFNAHQAAEKAIKAALIKLDIPYPHVHDLRRLFRLFAEAGIAVPGRVAEAARLTDYAVRARYPMSVEERPSSEEHGRALADAETVLHWAEEIIGFSTGI